MATSSLYIKDPIDRKITIDGIEYSWPQVPNDQGKGVDFEGPEQEALQMMLSDSVFADAHKRNVQKLTESMIQPTRSEVFAKREEDNKSGLKEALLAGMSNDQGYQMQWLADRRFRRDFPQIIEQGDSPVDYYFVDEDGDISYLDPTTKRVVKEFSEGIFGEDLMDSAGMVGPSAQFVFETVGGTVGLGYGSFFGGIPGAIVGGSGGTAAGATVAYAGRAGISGAFDGPPLKVSEGIKDLAWSVAFGGIPLGATHVKGVRNTLSSINPKFVGDEGRDALQAIIREGGSTADDKINFAKENFDITLTREEASGILSNGSGIQRYLQMQPGSQKLWDFYHDRAMQVEDIANNFFDELTKGKYLTKAKSARLSGKSGLEWEQDVAEAANNVLKRLATKREQRASKVYDNAFELDNAALGINDAEVGIDVSDLAKGLEAQLGDPNLVGKAREIKEKMLEALVDKSGFSATGYKNNTEMLHNALVNNFRPVIEGLTREGQAGLKREVSKMRAQVSERLKLANPEYARATAIYDPTKGHLQVLDRSIVSNFAKAAEIGGDRAVTLTSKLFSGRAKEKDIKLLRRLIETEDPQVWQNLKGNWLRTQFDEAVSSNVNPLGVPNRFLRALGLSGRPTQTFNEFKRLNNITEAQIRSGEAMRLFNASRSSDLRTLGRKARALKALMDPVELQNFIDIVELMQATSFIATRGGSPTQPLLAIQKAIEQEAKRNQRGIKSIGRQAWGAVQSLIEIPQRYLIRGFDDSAKAVLAGQREIYEDQLIQALIDPNVAKELAEALQKIKPFVYFITQAVAKGSKGVIEKIAEGDFGEGPTPSGMDRGSEGRKVYESAKELEALMEDQEQEEPIDNGVGFTSPAFEPLPTMASPPQPSQYAMSPTVLPSDEDRELAMRRAGQSGIAAL